MVVDIKVLPVNVALSYRAPGTIAGDQVHLAAFSSDNQQVIFGAIGDIQGAVKIQRDAVGAVLA